MEDTFFGHETPPDEDTEFSKTVQNTEPIELVAPFMQIDIRELQQNNLLLDWMGSARFKVWARLFSFSIRQKMANKMAVKIYEDYYIKKQKVVSRFSYPALGATLGCTKQAVNRHIKQLEKEGAFKISTLKWQKRDILIYEFGTWEWLPNGKKYEFLHIYNKLKVLNAKNKLKKYVK